MSLSILNISQNHYVRGGSDRYFFELAYLLATAGHEVIPFCSQQPANLPSIWERYFPRGVDFEQPSPAGLARFVYSLSARRAMRRLLREQSIDLAHLHIYYGQLTSSILAPLQKAGVPVVQTLHDFKLVCPVYSLMSHGQICEACEGERFYRAVKKRCNRGSVARSALSATESYVSRWAGSLDAIDHFIAVSNFQREKCVELGVPAERITTIHNFVDTSQTPPTVRPGEYVLYFGRLDRLKGVFTLLDAAAQMPDTPVVIAGTGPAEHELARRIEAEGLSNVNLVGFKAGDDLEQLIRGSICTVVPSEGYDNCPMAILESYALARPVVGARIGGIPELIENDRDGFIVPPANAEALAQRLRWLAERPNTAVEMGLEGRNRIESELNAEIHLSRVAEVYRRVGVTLQVPDVPASSTASLSQS